MKALITGAAGFIGSTLASKLAAEGHEIVGLDNFSSYYDPEIKRRNIARIPPLRFSLIRGDLVDAELAAILSDCDVVYHLAAQPGVNTSWGSTFARYVADNVLATQRLLDASVSAGIHRFVYASSSSVYGSRVVFPAVEESILRPFSPYGVSKLAAEHLCSVYADNFELSTVALRFFTVYGPAQRPDMAFSRFIRAGLAGDEITIHGDGSQVRDFTFVDDTVDALVRAGTMPVVGGSVFNVSGGSSASVIEVLDIIRELVGGLRVTHGPALPGDVRQTGGSSARLREELDWLPAVDLRVGLERQVEWTQAAGDM